MRTGICKDSSEGAHRLHFGGVFENGTAGTQLLTCDPEHGSLRRVQHRPSVDFPLGTLMSGQIPGQSITGCRGRRSRFYAVIILV